jgi:membrane fusion protein, multidrug efflux system
MKSCVAVVFILSLLAAGSVAVGAEAQPSVLVSTVPLRKEMVASSLTCFGVVSADPRGTASITLQRSTTVSRLFATQGEVVRAGASLAEVVTASADTLNYENALLAEDYAQRELARVENLVTNRLATQSQLAAARKALADAQASLKEQKKIGTGSKREVLKAPFAGTVTAISVKEGDHIPAGTSLMQISRRGALRVELGVEPEEIGLVKKGMKVLLTPVFGGKSSLSGTVHEIHGVINPQTRLVDVLVFLTGRNLDSFLPGMQVRGEIGISHHMGWVVPRQAVLSDSGGEYLFQVEKGHARRVSVVSGRAGKELVEVKGALNPELKVVYLGNYELEDGMAVREDEGR